MRTCVHYVHDGVLNFVRNNKIFFSMICHHACHIYFVRTIFMIYHIYDIVRRIWRVGIIMCKFKNKGGVICALIKLYTSMILYFIYTNRIYSYII